MRLQVTVHLHDEVVEDKVIDATDGLRLGEHDEAVVAFPGLDVLLSLDKNDDVIVVRGHRLRPGERYELSRGPVKVALSPVATERRVERIPLWRGDITLPVLLVAMVLATLSMQAAWDVLAANADVSDGVARGVEALILPEQLRSPEDEPPLIRPAWARPVTYEREATYEE